MSDKPMESVIRLVNKLQDAFTLLGYDPLSLPQICVVGGQSSGKSSVLENIVGRDFLPRGSGIVTRRPLVIQLIQNQGAEYGEFLHKSGKQFFDFDHIRNEIASATDEETGTNKGISDKPINLKIFSPHVLNLTLVDLPGITRVAVGDQPKDIERQIRAMILRYITGKNSIILAVTAGNTDLANSDAIQLSQEVDPDGLRTVGVITKVDIMDRGTNAMDVLMNQVVPLRLGYVAVINRAQADIDSGKRIDAQWKAEQQYFGEHPVYKRIADRCGTPYLTRTLNVTLINHIRHCLPEIMTKITSFMNEKEAELAKLVELDDPQQMQRVVLRSLTAYTDQFHGLINGSHTDVSGERLSGGARIAYIFRESFGRKLMDLDFFDVISDKEIQTTIRNCVGLRGGLFIPDSAFEVMVRRVVKQLEGPAKICVQMVFEELLTLINTIATDEMTRFGKLHAKVQDAARALLHACMEPTTALVSTLLDMEMARINTTHPDFLGSRQAVSQLMAQVETEVKRKKSDKDQAQREFRDGAGADDDDGGDDDGGRAPPMPPPPGAKPALLPPGGAGGSSTKRRPFAPAASSSAIRPPPPPSKAGKPRVTLEDLDTEMTEREAMETEVIRRLLKSYFDIVRKKVVDSVPKAVTLRLIKRAEAEMHDSLVAALYKEDLITELLQESADTIAKRKSIREVLTLMQSSLQAIQFVSSSSELTH